MCLFDCYQNQRPWMTLNDRTALYSQMMHLSELIAEIRKKIDPYCQRQKKCSTGTLLSGGIRFMQNIHEGSVPRGLKRQRGG